MARLKDLYKKDIVPAMMEQFSYKNVNMVPKMNKIVINVGVGEAVQNSKAIESVVSEITQISGQKPIVTKAKKSIATFKLREGMPIGVKVTLRGVRMYEFMDRFINASLPRVRDFKGVSLNGFDGRGNYTVGIKEQLIFPEIEYDKVDKMRGMNITFITTAKTDEEAKELLVKFGTPFAKQ
ncbi:MAG: 50S ribosomal protein L5 [Firmicutes bacterium]|nr:50S ribosomal protein L5 [Bacillota bacterium]